MSFIKGYSDITDVASFTVFCASEPSVLVLFREEEYSFPKAKVTGSSITDVIAVEMKEIFGEPLMPSRLGVTIQVWAPHLAKEYFMHFVFGANCNLDQKKKSKHTAGKYRNQIRWLSEQDLKQGNTSESVYTPLMGYMYQTLKEQRNPEVENRTMEFIVVGPYVEVAERCVMVPHGNLKTTNIYEQLIDSAGMVPSVQIAIYKEFLSYSYPSALLSCNQFAKMVVPLGFSKDDIIFLFRAADLQNRKSLTPKEFIYIMAAMDPATNHGGGAAEVRSRYIFRFFDRDRDGFISYNELKTMVIYLRKIKSQPLDMNSIDKDLEGVCKAINFAFDTKMQLSDFLKNVSELKVRGLSQILRTTKGMKASLQSKTGDTRTLSSSTKIASVSSINPPGEVTSNQAKGGMPKPVTSAVTQRSGGDYEVALHTVKMQKSGTMINLDLLFNLQTAVSNTTLIQADITERSRRVSIAVYGQTNICNELVRNLRVVVRQNNVRSGNRGNRKDTWMWGNTNCQHFADQLLLVCDQCKALFKSEPRMIDVKSPSYIMGDLHGNYGDLMFLEKMFWPLSPGICPASLLFLGDFVDRGPFGIEVITYLFCYKVMFPHKMKLVRGNHEIRDIQKLFTFKDECFTKFGEKLGKQVWETINDVFDCLPIAAVVDGKIFCVHGGIPPPWLCPSAQAINSIIMPLSKPDEQSALAWEIMWNDPIKDSAITDDLKVELLANDGFAKNTKRGTAHMFNQLALERFLSTNGFTHIIRAHEVQGCGFNVQLKGRLLTVFSSSRYGNQQNEAACILADCGRLRMLRLDTTS